MTLSVTSIYKPDLIHTNSVWHKHVVVAVFVVGAFDCIAAESEAFQFENQNLVEALTSVEAVVQAVH